MEIGEIMQRRKRLAYIPKERRLFCDLEAYEPEYCCTCGENDICEVYLVGKEALDSANHKNS